MKLYKQDADNCILALRNSISEYKKLAENSKEEYLKNGFNSMANSMQKTLNVLEKEFKED